MESPAIHKTEAQVIEGLVESQIVLTKKLKKMEGAVSHMKMMELKKSAPPSYLNTAKIKSFNEHLAEDYGMNLSDWNDYVQDNLDRGRVDANVPLKSLRKSLYDARRYEQEREKMRGSSDFIAMRKAQESGDHEGFEAMAKSVLGGPNSSGEAGSYQAFLQENLSDAVIEIILDSADCQATECISTAITPSINPEFPRLKSTGVGYGKHTLGFNEGGTPIAGGGQVQDRVAKTLVQRGIKALVTELLIANKKKIVSYDPLNAERRLRIIERNLQINHLLIYGSDQINKNGTEVQEMSGILEQMENSGSTAITNIHDWNGQGITEANSAPDLFRAAAETLIKVGKIPGGSITGKFSCLLDYGVANQFSRLFDATQRVNIDRLNTLSTQYGQGFSGVVTDLGIFNFKRTRTLELVNGNSWTPAGEESKNAIIWPAVTPTAVATASAGEQVGGVAKSLPAGTYSYKVSVVNDHGESDVSASFLNGVAVSASEKNVISIAYDSAFAGGNVNGYTVSPARYFILYRADAGQTADAEHFPIAKIPINGTSTTTYSDYNQKMPNRTDMFFISNNPLDVAHTSLIPPKEIPIFDPSKATSHIWSIYDIANLTLWAPERVYVVRNLPSSVQAP